MLIGVFLMVMLWFRPQGVVPERPRQSATMVRYLGKRGRGKNEAPIEVDVPDVALNDGSLP
jgi:hypothetical protein